LSHYPHHLILGVSLFLAALAVQAVTANSLARRKLRLTLYVALGHIAINVFLVSASFPVDEPRWRSIEQLLLWLGAINLLVTIAINPLRSDRVPEAFPAIVQDAITVGLVLLIGTVILQEKFLTTSAVGAVVVGFALQDTLGNAFAGLAIQVEKPFRVGHWIRIGDFEGQVTQVTWRATKLRTKAGNFVVLPNNIISKEAISNFSEPSLPTRLSVVVGASYQTPPNEVKAALREAVGGAPLALAAYPSETLLHGFGASAIDYEVRFWIDDFAHDASALDQVRTAIYYVFKRRGIEIPWPIQVEYSREEPPAQTPERRAEIVELVGRVEVLAPLSGDERASLVASSVERLFGAGEVIVRQGAPGSSMYLVCSGQVLISVEPHHQEVATVGPGDFFGEMSLLTGEPRNATATAVGDCVLLEVTVDALRRIVLANPVVAERIAEKALLRRAGLDRASVAALALETQGDAGPVTFFDRMKRFLRLSVS
jgi:small-conductance mechanosensitive channel